MAKRHQPGDCYWDPKQQALMEVQPDGSVSPVRSWMERMFDPEDDSDHHPIETPEELAAWRPDGPDEHKRETLCDREDRLHPKLLDRDEEDRARLAAEVPADQREDGWTLARRELFLERLADTCSVLEAAASVGLSRQSARKLYRRAPAFRAAWDLALQESVSVLAETAFHRARFGTETEVYHNGHVVGHRTVHHDRLLMYLLRVRDPLNYAPVDEVERWQKQRALPARARSISTLEAAAPAPAPAALEGPNQGNLETYAPATPLNQGNLETSEAATPPHQGNMETSPAPVPNTERARRIAPPGPSVRPNFGEAAP